MSLPGEACGEQDPEPVVVEVPEPAAGSLDSLDGEVRGFDGTVARAGGVVGEDLVTPAAERLRETAQLGAGLHSGAPSDRIVEQRGGVVGVVGEIDVADLLLRDPRVADLVARITRVERRVDARPAGRIDSFRAEEQEPADVVERVAVPAAMLERLLLRGCQMFCVRAGPAERIQDGRCERHGATRRVGLGGG